MDRRLLSTLVGGMVAMILCATPVSAGSSRGGPASSNDPDQECAELERQFDIASQRHQRHPEFPEARNLRDQGAALCVAHNDAAGTMKLKQALTKLGVKPTYLRSGRSSN